MEKTNCDVCGLSHCECGTSMYIEEMVKCECGKFAPLSQSHIDEDGCWYCPECYDSAINETQCRVCGCTDSEACEGGCYWVEEDLCSRCKLQEMAHQLHVSLKTYK